MRNENIFKMNLHDEILFYRENKVLRVPGGWIYFCEAQVGDGTVSVSTCFVPLNYEFSNKHCKQI